MEELSLTIYPDPVLSNPSSQVTVFDQELEDLASHMLDLMYDSKGIGLAAPQVGRARRLIVADWTSPDVTAAPHPQVLVNPVITVKSVKTEVAPEGCLSLPGVVVNVARSLFVRCEYQDLRGNKQECEARGLPARVLQHEIDHLDGIMMLKHLTQSHWVTKGEKK